MKTKVKATTFMVIINGVNPAFMFRQGLAYIAVYDNMDSTNAMYLITADEALVPEFLAHPSRVPLEESGKFVAREQERMMWFTVICGSTEETVCFDDVPDVVKDCLTIGDTITITRDREKEVEMYGRHLSEFADD